VSDADPAAETLDRDGALGPGALAALAHPDAYPDDASATHGVEEIQTHLSHVFLTRDRVYKFRKPVELSFVRFVERAERDEDCVREVALNRRLAPDVYLGIAPLLVQGDRVRVGPIADALSAAAGSGPEHCVVMRRLPSGRDALSLLEGGTLAAHQLGRVAVKVAAFHRHQGLGVPAPFEPEEWRQRCVKPAEENLRLLSERAAALRIESTLEICARRTREFVAVHADRFERRRREGRAVDGHGDLHLQHLWFESDDAEPIAIDCIEFQEGFRRIDAAAEVAFPAMDLIYRGRPELAEHFLRIYARESDDFDLYAVVDYFTSYRAAVRAKVAALAAEDPAMDSGQRERAAESAGRHVALAGDLLAPRDPGPIVLVGGIVGTGKTSVAEALAARLDASGGAAVISTDRVRKREAGLAVEATIDAEVDRGLYTPEQRHRTYAAVIERAAPVVGSGRCALLDATWSRRDERRAAVALARRLGTRAVFVETRCAEAVALERLARRAAEGRDASDAGPDFYAESRDRFEPITADEGLLHRLVATDDPEWREHLTPERLALQLG
jgi:aminoglycoside phosphotransferase family enzyme/predicted kinase